MEEPKLIGCTKHVCPGSACQTGEEETTMCHQKETRTNQKLTSSIATYNVVFVVNIAGAGEVGTQRNCDEGGLQDPLASHAASHFKTSNYKNSAYDGGQKWTILFYLRLSRRIGRLLFRNGTVAREGSAGG